MIALLNAPLLTSYGTFDYKHLPVMEAQKIIANDFDSYIGHQSSCDILSAILNVNVPLHRGQYQQKVGEQAIVFKLHHRLAEGEVLYTLADVEKVGYELALITKIK